MRWTHWKTDQSQFQSNHALSGLKAALGLKDLVQETNVVDNID